MKFIKRFFNTKPLKIILFTSVIVIILANAISVGLIDYIIILSLSPETRITTQIISAQFWTNIISRVLPFPLALIFTIYYVWPVIRHIRQRHKPQDFSDAAKIKLLNFPFVLSFVSLLSWFLGNFLHLMCGVILNVKISFTTIFELNISSLVLGGITFVITYYTLEYLQREFIISKIFPTGEINLTKKSIKMDIPKKLFIFLLASVVLPSLIYYRFLETFNNHGQNSLNQNMSNVIFIFCLSIILTSTLITYFKSYSIRKPIIQMIEAAKKIEYGNFDIKVPVYSEDEISELAQRINRMAKGLKEREYMKQVFDKVVDPNIRDYLLNNSQQLGGELKDVTILFCDLEGFSTLSEKLSPLAVVSILNQYFEVMTDIISSEKGLVNKYIGDAILAVFGAPIEMTDHADAALRAAVKMQEALKELNRKFLTNGTPTLQNRIGIHSGEVLAGIVGSKVRMEYTVIGDTVNIASRLEKVAKDVGQSIVISEQTQGRLQTQAKNVEFLNEVRVRGRSESVRIYKRVG